MRWAGYVAAVATVGVLLAVLRLATVETAGIAAPVLLVTVVIIARFKGMGPALLAAALSAAGLSYYFLPPFGFEIEQPQDWVAFLTFVVAAIVAGELASRAERRTAEAHQGRLEIERLYRHLQAAFDRASEAEAARRNEQLKAALLDALTHNLRTPLTSIKAAVTALIGAGAWTPQSDLSSEGRRELLLVIDEESDRLNRFIEGLSSADRRDVAQVPTLRRERLDGMVRAAVTRAENLTRDHRVDIQLDEDLPLLSVDAASIVEVLYTLIDNASKYSPARTRIDVKASHLDDRFVRVSVVDEGPGVPPELRERVFENFFRIPGREPSDPRRVGVGLGLPIARRLVEAQGGRISVEAGASNHGTAVVLMLPVASPDSEPARPSIPVEAIGYATSSAASLRDTSS
jgi:K+-sensing histidine kinase KdpD